MIVAGASGWVNHFRHGSAELSRMLNEKEVGLHPFIVGEISAGNLKHRAETLGYLACLPQAAVAQENEVHHLVESQKLWGWGLGWVDLHILTAVKLAGWSLYTADRAMNGAALRLGIPSR